MISMAPHNERPVPIELARSLNRHRVLFIGVAAAVAALVWVTVGALPPRYTAFASIVITPASPDPLPAGIQSDAGLRDDEVATQAALLTSRDLVEPVVARYPVQGGTGLSERLTNFVCSLARNTRRACAPEPEPSKDLAGFVLRLKATPVPRTRMIELSYSDADPQVAADTLNALVEADQAHQIEQRSRDLSRTSSWISERALVLRQHWLDAEAKAGQLRTASGLAASGTRESAAPLVTQQLSNAATSLSTAQAELAAARARQAALRAATTAPDRNGFLNMRDEPGLVSLATQLSVLVTQLADLQSHFNGNFPGLVAIQAQIASLEKQIRTETTRSLRTIEVELQVKQAAVETLSKTVKRLGEDAADANSKQVQVTTLDDEAQSARTVFETFLARAKQLDDRAALLQASVQFAAHATVPSQPSFPDRPRLRAAGVLLGIVFGAAAVWLREFMARGFSNISRIGEQLAVPFLCAIPSVGSRIPGGSQSAGSLPRYVQDHPFSAASEAMHSLLNSLQLDSVKGEAVRSVVIASATGQEGKTTTSIWLAGAAAMGGRKVILVDGDQRRGMINERLQGTNPRGFTDLVFGMGSIGELIQQDPDHKFDFIGAGAPVSRSFGRQDVERLQSIISALEGKYDLVIIDTPPLLAVSDALLYASLASRTVFLCRWNRTSRIAVANCLAKLRMARASILGIALSMIDHRRLAQFSDELTPYDVRVIKRYYVN